MAHDHPGIASRSFVAVDFPGGPRFDLGLLEMLFLIPMSIAWMLAWRRPRPAGTYVRATILTYAPVRFALDFLRAEDVRYGFLTPAQWIMAAALIGVAFYCRLHHSRTRTGSTVIG